MRRVVLIGVAAAVALPISSDSRSPVQPESISLPLSVSSARHDGDPHGYSVHLSGDQEPTPVPPAPSPQDSNAQGQGIFKIAGDELSMDYKLIASNIRSEER